MARTTGSTSFLQFTINQLEEMGYLKDEPIWVSRVKLEDRAKKNFQKNFQMSFPAQAVEQKPVQEVQVTEINFDEEK
jgi:hypothetical protein